MGLKQKLGLGVASAAMGLALIGGGTYAYFSDTEVSNNVFAAGSLDLAMNPTTIVNVDNLKPGDTMLREFDLMNNGSLDIGTIDLKTGYQVVDHGNNNSDDFGKHIRVNFLLNADKLDVPIFSTTLHDLQNMSPDVIEGHVFTPWFIEKGGKLAAGTSDKLYVQFEFVDNGQDQNQFQKDKLKLEWTFEAMQTEGKAR
ncbi:CalY family protein [Jeotgalibacillus sp. R-1-5s-1]|uniref:CalY family protein n=1 Tax=Jeotgalibacillus sp. R-1-5s-1 TaxID=2555897 RepID=UPI00106B5878|nr:CalY family protein [Jeotgalibacillus sp. R-1-5s-1]TFD97086.1 cell division protein FtsN [Jeotgalibacillus sp. R-1-5s-1]